MMLFSPLLSSKVMAVEKVTTAKQVSTEGKELQKELQFLYLVMKTNADANQVKVTAPQRQIMTELETCNK